MPTYRITALATVQLTRELSSRNDVATVIEEGYEIKAVEEVQVDYPAHAPHIEIEYDESYWGGNYDQVGSYAYIPLELIEEIGAEEAFQIVTKHDRANIVNINSSDDEELYQQNGKNWFEAASEWAGNQAEQLKQQGCDLIRLSMTNPEQIVLKSDRDGSTIATYETGTSNLALAEALCNTVEGEFLIENVEVVK